MTCLRLARCTTHDRSSGHRRQNDGASGSSRHVPRWTAAGAVTDPAIHKWSLVRGFACPPRPDLPSQRRAARSGLAFTCIRSRHRLDNRRTRRAVARSLGFSSGALRATSASFFWACSRHRLRLELRYRLGALDLWPASPDEYEMDLVLSPCLSRRARLLVVAITRELRHASSGAGASGTAESEETMCASCQSWYARHIAP